MKQLSKEFEVSLQKIANDNDALLMSFIASGKVVRSSPSSIDYASITMTDLYSIEEKVDALLDKSCLPGKLMLVIHTPGGSLYAATKIAKYISNSFKEIDIYVPYEAASGGTMICLVANEIILDRIANLTPIDPQIQYKGFTISCATYQDAIDEFHTKYGKLSPGELPSPFQQMAGDFDPILYKEFDKLAWDTISLAFKLLIKSQGEVARQKSIGTAFGLVKNRNTTHSHVIDVDEAVELGLNISTDVEKIKNLKYFKKWVSENLDEEDTKHIIQCFSPNKIAKHENGKQTEATPAAAPAK